MAHGDFTLTNSAKGKLGDGSIDWDATNGLRCSLHNGALPNIDTAISWADVSGTEVALANYTAGGVTLTGSTPTIDTANNWAEYDMPDPSWTSLGSGTVTHAWVRYYNATASLSWLIGYYEITTNQPNGGNWSITVNVDGVFKAV